MDLTTIDLLLLIWAVAASGYAVHYREKLRMHEHMMRTLSTDKKQREQFFAATDAFIDAIRERNSHDR